MTIIERLDFIYKKDSRRNRFLLVILCSGLAYGFYRGIQDNYLAQIIQISKFERGIVEFFRELPGLFLVFILAAMYRFSESKVFKIGTAVMLMGLLGLLLVGSSKILVILFMVIFSTGEHITMPIKSSMSLDMAKPGKGGASLGLMTSISNGGNIIGFIGVTVLFFILSRLGVPEDSIVGFKTVFFIATLLIICSTLIAFAIKDQGKPVKRSKIYFSKKFSKYYMLEIFYGARKQIFLTFAPYVLILYYGADTSLVALLLAICAAFGMLLAPLMGKLIDKLGYKFVMVTDTLLLMVVCFFYGYAHLMFSHEVAFLVVSINFVLDSIISLASMAAKVYIQDIASTQEELTSTITTGISVNHLISVLIALLGGYIWQTVGMEVLFTLSAILGLINTLFALTIKKPKPLLAEVVA
jgi:MFS family permease